MASTGWAYSLAIYPVGAGTPPRGCTGGCSYMHYPFKISQQNCLIWASAKLLPTTKEYYEREYTMSVIDNLKGTLVSLGYPDISLNEQINNYLGDNGFTQETLQEKITAYGGWNKLIFNFVPIANNTPSELFLRSVVDKDETEPTYLKLRQTAIKAL